MTGYDLKNALHSDKVCYGTMLVSDSPKYVDAVKKTGVDFVFICTEHIAIDRQQLSWMCQAYKASGIVPVVRIPSPDPYAASMVIDGGACGVIAPYVETAEQVRQLVGAVKYKPLKGEKLDNILNGKEELEPKLKAYLEEENKNHLLIVNIESTPAMKNLDEILKVPGLDAVLIGPHDLSTSQGISMEYTNEQYDAAVREIISKARRAGIGAGNHVHYPGDINQQVHWAREEGANLIVHRSDILSFTITMSNEIAYLRDKIANGLDTSGEASEGNGGVVLNI